jgi:uncharacterized membrane protein
MKSHALTPILIALAAALITGLCFLAWSPDWLHAMARVVAVYDVAALAMLLWFWRIILPSTAAQTKARAAAEDPGRDALFILTLVAVAFGFVAAFTILGRAPSGTVHHRAALYAIGFAAVALGWLLIHTIFVFRYAHLYYRDRDRDKASDRGLTFPGGEEPNYTDLAYFSFVIGMTFQVSDVQITARGIRRLVLAHGLISFAYNTAILALVVNVVSGLLNR